MEHQALEVGTCLGMKLFFIEPLSFYTRAPGESKGVEIGGRPDSAEDFPARNLRPSLNRHNTLDSAMQVWRRTFATSVARLGSSSTTNARPALLRCAQILHASKTEGLCSLEDQEVKVNGFIRSVRKQKKFAFAEISDGSTVEPLQAILKSAQAAEYVALGSCGAQLACHEQDLTRTLLQSFNGCRSRNLRDMESMSAWQGADTWSFRQPM